MTNLPVDPSRQTYRLACADDALCLGVLSMQVFMDTCATRGARPSVARAVLGACSTEAWAARLERIDCRVEVAEFDGHRVAYARHGFADHGQTWFEPEGGRHEKRLLAKAQDAPR
jgi:hypothetical protein